MAIRFRKDRKSLPWQVYWTNPHTKKRESACFATQQEAEKEESLIKHRLRFERDWFTTEETKKEPEQAELTLEQVHLLYLKEKQFSKPSLAWQMDSMKASLKKWGTLPLSAITKEGIKAEIDAMLKTNVKPVTVRGRFRVLRTVLRWAAEHEFCEEIKFPKLPAGVYEQFIPPTTEEIAKILSVAPPHIQRVIIFGSQFGVRVGPCELFQLTWNDVDLTSHVLRVHGSKKNKHSPWREVPIRTSLIPVFERWREEDLQSGDTYLIHFRGKPVKSILCAWNNALKHAGISRRIRPYDLRHAFATEAIAAGADIGTVARLMGHANPNMILNHYQYILDKQKKATVEALPEVPIVPTLLCPLEAEDAASSKTQG